MKIQRLVADVTAVGSPGIAEHDILEVMLARWFSTNSGCISGRGATLWCRNPLLSSNIITQSHLMKIKSLLTDITAVGFPEIAERAILGVILAWRCFGQFRPSLWSGSHFVMWEPPLELYYLYWGHLMKIKWLVADVTAVGSSDRAEHILAVMLAGRFFGQFRLYYWSGCNSGM